MHPTRERATDTSDTIELGVVGVLLTVFGIVTFLALRLLLG